MSFNNSVRPLNECMDVSYIIIIIIFIIIIIIITGYTSEED